MTKPTKPSIYDVARQAGVSTSTVSHTINRTRNVSEASRKRVMKAIEELGYMPDAFARSLRTGKKNMIGFIVPDMSNMFFAALAEIVESILSPKGYHLIIANTNETPEREEAQIQFLSNGIVDGLLLASTLEDGAALRQMIPSSFPTVLIDRNFADAGLDSVTASSYDAVYKSITQLAARGHTKIGYIAGLPRLNTTAERLSAYKQALIDSEIPVSDAFITYSDTAANSAYQCTENLIQQGCTAIVVSNTLMFSDVEKCFDQHGIRDGIDLVCFCDYEFYLHSWLPRTDLIVQPVGEMGKKAADQILYRLDNPDSPQREIILQCVFSGSATTK